MHGALPRRYIIVVPPTATAGIGNALRLAYRPDQGRQVFEQLVARLDQLG